MGSLPISRAPSMEEQVHAPLSSLETSLTTLVTTLTATPTYSGAPAATSALLVADDALTSALQTLHTHQQNYAKILRLRAEAQRLEDTIRSTVRTCIELRNEIGSVHPSNLIETADSDGSEDDEDDEEGGQDVDYQTLLSFASKVGKYNTEAAKEADAESLRRIAEARNHDQKNAATGAMVKQIKLNGTTPTTPHPTSTTSVSAPTPFPTSQTTQPQPQPEPQSQSLIPQHERDWLDAEAALSRARSGMSFPAAETLRLGLLGRMQFAREQGGEEAVEKMIRELEGRRVDEVEVETETEMEIRGQVLEDAGGELRGVSVTGPVRGVGQENMKPQTQTQRPPQEKKVVSALDLDMWKEDDDDDDD